MQPISISDPSDYTGQAGVFIPNSQLKVAPSPTTLFYDVFDTTLDTTIKWTAIGTAPSITSGLLNSNAGTVAGTSSGIVSRPTFSLVGNMFVNALSTWKVDAGPLAGAYRFFGLGNAQGSPTAAAPITDGAGFEFNHADGSFNCVVWAGSVRTVIPFSTTPPVPNIVSSVSPNSVYNGKLHRYAIYYKTSTTYWEVDNIIVAKVSEPNLSVSTLPVLLLTVNGTATLGTAMTSSNSVAAVGDTAGNGSQLNDGLYPWLKQRISFTDGAAASNIGGNQTAVIAAAASGVIKASQGRLCNMLITVAGTAAITLYDNASAASGTIIGITPAVTTAGTVYQFQLPAVNGIYASGGAGSPGVTIGFN